MYETTSAGNEQPFQWTQCCLPVLRRQLLDFTAVKDSIVKKPYSNRVNHGLCSYSLLGLQSESTRYQTIARVTVKARL